MRFLSIAVLLTLSSAVVAQDYPVPYYAVGSNNYRHASTVEEGAARGMADVIRSTGAANLMNSEAAKNIEDARKKYIENRLQATQTYFEMKQINKQARWGNQKRPTQADLIRYSQARLPDRLNHLQLDPLSGTLTWPMLLRLKELEPHRKRMQELFELRAKEGFVGPDEYVEIQNIVKAMSDVTKSVAKNFPTSATIDARKFLEGLAYEARFQAG